MDTLDNIHRQKISFIFYFILINFQILILIFKLFSTRNVFITVLSKVYPYLHILPNFNFVNFFKEAHGTNTT